MGRSVREHKGAERAEGAHRGAEKAYKDAKREHEGAEGSHSLTAL